MKKVGIAVLAVCLFLPAMGFAQSHKESKKEKIARLEGEVVALKMERQTAVEQANRRADSLAGVAARAQVQLEMANTQYAALEAQYKQQKEIKDSLATLNQRLEAEITKAQAAAAKNNATIKKQKKQIQQQKENIQRLEEHVKSLNQNLNHDSSPYRRVVYD